MGSIMGSDNQLFNALLVCAALRCVHSAGPAPPPSLTSTSGECEEMVKMHGGGLIPSWGETWCPGGHLCAWGSIVQCERDGDVQYKENDFLPLNEQPGSHYDPHKATEGFPSTILGDSP